MRLDSPPETSDTPPSRTFRLRVKWLTSHVDGAVCPLDASRSELMPKSVKSQRRMEGIFPHLKIERQHPSRMLPPSSI
jgi:hypothetical protein